ncbi:MAG: DUF6106 family protein [Candidatus Merdivicinus sp.]
MDVFIEYMVKKQSTSTELLLKILYVLAAAVLLIGSFFVAPFLGMFSMIATLIGFGAVYGAYYLITSMSVEYEYILTNGEMDVDKIIARRRRKRLLTANARKFEEFGAYNHQAMAQKTFNNRVYACTAPEDPGNYYAVFNHATLGQTLLVFTPNDRVLEGLRTFVPRKAGGNAVYGNRPDQN